MLIANASGGRTKMETKNEFTLEEQMRGLVEQLDAYIETYHGGSVEYISYQDKKVKDPIRRCLYGLSAKDLHSEGLD